MVNFTAREVRDIIISMLFIAVIFAFIFSQSNINAFILLIPSLLIAVGLGFILHELAHKFVAIRYGFYAEFRIWFEGLIFAVITAIIIKLAFVAPGAVYIHGNNISREQNGKISLAGPLVNIVLALIFLGLTPYINYNANDVSGFIISNLLYFGFFINSYLAAFNLIPISILDGAKVFRWNPIIWGVTFAFSVILVLKALNYIQF
ncbi:MAG: site-2 protease family protein [Methanobacterium sp.]|uniref:site-2 protease family protein n=1 Tax=Methanobacterium sp. TaxID=2164 RepID=UPI003C7622D4